MSISSTASLLHHRTGHYCGDSQWLPLWSNGFSICFIRTLSASLMLLWLIIALPLVFIRWNYQGIHNQRELRRTWCVRMQLVLLGLLALYHIVLAIVWIPLYSRDAFLIYSFIVYAVTSMLSAVTLYHATFRGIVFARGVYILMALGSLLELASFANSMSSWNRSKSINMYKVDIVALFVRVIVGVVLVGMSLWQRHIAKGLHKYTKVSINDDSVEVNVEEEAVQSKPSPFRDFLKKSQILWPYVWQSDSMELRLRIYVCLLLLISVRVANVYVPIYSKHIVNALSHSPPAFSSVYPSVLIYCALKFALGSGSGSGAIDNLRSFLWISIDQNTNRKIRVDVLDHLHSLSLQYHLNRKTGEVLLVLDRGTSSISALLSTIVFRITPTLVDIVVAVIYLGIKFDVYFGLIVLVTMSLYVGATVGITEWRTKFRRLMNDKANDTRQKAVDSLINFETVKYYCCEAYEVARHNDSIRNYQLDEWKSNASLNVLNLSQNIIITVGILAGTLLCSYRVAAGVLTVGDYVLYISYVTQLYSPLNFFGTYYRMTQQYFIDMENLLELWAVKPDLVDIDDATELAVSNGEIEFDNVSFHYDPERPILTNVSFTIPGGQRWAIVGSSGGGKSTVIRLLFRFYDLNGGSIRIDGQDIASVTQNSLRRAIGVVPQDTSLFRDTLLYNIRYGRVDIDPALCATDEEAIDAAKKASIHDQVMNFPLQYDTIVGERGLRLSGGEKQRTAIARTLLKQPPILLLDEATSALDTETERVIQHSLDDMSQGRTSLTVAHRLSTIIDCDQILVLQNGHVAERGTFADLLAIEGGVFAQMWTMQRERDNTSSDDDKDINKDDNTK